MATIDYSNYDFLAGAVENQEYERSTWRTDQRHFARSERRVITVYKRDMDDSHDVTLFALENVIAIIVSREHSFRFGVYKQWEADFLRHLLGHTTFEEEHSYNEVCNRNISLCSDHSSIECRIGKKLTALLRHGSPLKKHMYSNGAVELRHVLECCNPDVNPYDKFNVGRLFAAFIQGNNKQRYFIEVALNDDWFLGSSKLPWKIFIGCNQGHTTGFVRAVENSHQLTMIELSCLGWVFHVTDQKFVSSIFQHGLKRFGRDTLHFMYDNDNGTGYIRKGPGTKPPRHYETSRYCILKTTMLLGDGYDLFLTSNGVVLCYDDIPCNYFEIVKEFPYLGYHFANRTTGHGLPPEIKIGTWRHNMTVREKYEEYLPSGEISQYLENDQIVEWRVPHSPFPKRRTTAWEFMGQEVPERYLKLLNNFPNDRRNPEACDDMPYGLPSSLTSEVGNTPVDIYIATEEATGSASAEVVGSGSTGSASAEVVEELSTRSKLELQAVQIIAENPWHLFQSGIMTLRNNKGERITNVFGEAVLTVREYHLLSTSQQEDLRSQGITRHIWERYPLSGHAILFCTRAWEIGRMTGYVKKYHSTAEAEAYQQKLQYNEFVGWRRDVPEPFAARPEDRNPASLARERTEEEEYNKDGYEVRMFDLFAEAVEDLYTNIIDAYVRKTPALWEEFVMKKEDGNWYLVDPIPSVGEPTEATAENLCLDIHNNLKFSPQLCLWAIERKLKETDEKPPPGSFAEFVLNQLRKYIEGRSAIDDDYYKHLVINTQSRTFEDANYVNSIGSKVVIRPLSETLEFSAKKDLQLQRTVMWKDLPSPSQDAMDTGDLPSGEIPESTEEAEAVDLPSGEMAVEATADVPEDLPTGKRPRTEAKEEEDVEMEEVKEEEPPQVDPDASLAPEEEAPDFEGDVEIDDDVSETSSQKQQRANRLLNSGILDRYAHSSDDEDEDAPRLGPRPRMAPTAMANFIASMLPEDREFIDDLLTAEEEKRQRRHEEGVRFTELEPKEEVRYGEELEERKQQDIFSHTSTREFMEALRPEMDENLSSAQSSLERILFQEPARQTYQRLHSNKMSLLEPLEPEERVKIEVPKPQRTEDPMAEEEPYDCALDKLGQLDKYNKNKNFGFYGKYFRETHARSLNFYKYRTTNPAGHPHCLFEFDEEKFMDTYVQLFFLTPTIEDYFQGKTIVYGCEDHRLRVANTEPQEQRSRIARQLFEERQLKLRDMVAGAAKNEFSYDDIISDITELFLSGEKIERNPESLGSSSKSLTTLMWNLGNWRRGMNWRLPSVVDEDKIYYKEHRKEKFPDHVEENNNLFLQMLKNLRAHIMLVCEAGTLEPHQKYLQDHGWSLCFNDAKDLCVLARLGKDGSIVQIGGPKDENVWSGPNRKISFGIFEICWGLAIDRETYSSSSTGYFDRNTVQDFVDMERAKMKVTRVCVYHVDHDSAGKSHGVTGEVFAHMLYECICHQVTIVGGDANRLCYYKSGKQLNSSYSMSTCQFWTERMEQTMDKYFKDVLQNNKDFNVRQFHSMSYLDLKYLQDTIGGRQDLLREVRQETDKIGDCCLLTFFEYGLSTPDEVFHDGNNSDLLEYKYSVNELLFYLTNDVLLLREKDKDAHCPLLVTIEPSDMTNKEKRTFNTVEQKKQRAANRKEIQKQNKAKGKARAST